MEGQRFFFTVAAGVGLALLLSRRNGHAGGYAEFSRSDLVNPNSVAKLAASLNGTGDEEQFILNAWDWVGRMIPYERTASDLEFVNSHVVCARCLLPTMTLAHGSGNCVAKSALLASLLRNRLPPERVSMVIGDYDTGVPSPEGKGHAWVEVTLDGVQYLLEATKSPNPDAPWVLAESRRDKYEPYVYLNDLYFSCTSSHLCMAVPARCGALTGRLST